MEQIEVPRHQLIEELTSRHEEGERELNRIRISLAQICGENTKDIPKTREGLAKAKELTSRQRTLLLDRMMFGRLSEP